MTQDTTRPTVNAGNDTTLTCAQGSIALAAITNAVNASFAWSNGANTQATAVTAAGTYTVTVTNNDNGCTAVDEVSIIYQKLSANNDVINTCEDENVTFNLTDNDGPGISSNYIISIIQNPVHGSINVVNVSGSISYTPSPNYNGSDSFRYSVCNTTCAGECDTATVYVNVCPVNDAPVSDDVIVTIPQDSTATICVPFNDPDGDSISVFVINCGAVHGIFNSLNSNCINYIPNIGWYGIDTLCVVVCDNGNPQQCDSSIIIINVIPFNNVVAVTDTAYNQSGLPVVIDILGNDYDPQNHSFCFTQIISQPSYGVLSFTYVLNDSCKPLITYQSNHGYIGYDYFCYSITDQFGAIDTACVLIIVDTCYLPVAQNDVIVIQQGADTLVNVLSNDKPNGFSVIGIVQSSGVGSIVTVSGNRIRYQANPNFSGSDMVLYSVTNACGSDTGILTIVIQPVCRPVNAINDYQSTLQNNTINGNVLVNDVNPNNTTLQANVVKEPSNGTISMNVSGNYTYSPVSLFTGNDTVIYTACTFCGNSTLCDTAILVIKVDPVTCDPPVAVDDTSYVGFNCQTNLSVTVNDSNTNGAIVKIITPASYGNVQVNKFGSVIYTASGINVVGLQDSFTYSICNSCGGCDTAKVTVNITNNPCNGLPPVANTDTYRICKNNTVLLKPLQNDFDPENTTLALQSIIYNGSGQAAIFNPSQIQYTPVPEYIGADRMQYVVCDGGVPSLCDTAEIVLIINNCQNRPPEAQNPVVYDTTLINQPGFTCLPVTDPDGDEVVITSVVGEEHGTVLYFGDTLCFSYNPFTNYTGNDTFTVVVCDNNPNGSLCDTILVIYTIRPSTQNKPPVAVDDLQATGENQPVVISVLLNDYDPDTNTIYVCGINQPANGVVVVNSNGTVTYTPNPGFNGIDSFQYILCDNGVPVLSDTATVVIYVGNVWKPVANGYPCDSLTTFMNTPLQFNMLKNDILIPADDTILFILSTSGKGKVELDGSFNATFTPDEGFKGNYSITYNVCVVIAGKTSCDTASVCISVIDTTVACYFPNAISPNGDGDADVLIIECTANYPNASVKVFNRWGNEVWYSKGRYENDWKGENMDGSPVPDGTYYYVFEYNDGTGRRFMRFITVNR
ncbi:MAG: Ig-like domain-containing protein [Chitinophagales bacterium]|nr:Ig-like domain-containing protein [Chitinophagales bacterium]